MQLTVTVSLILVFAAGVILGMKIQHTHNKKVEQIDDRVLNELIRDPELFENFKKYAHRFPLNRAETRGSTAVELLENLDMYYALLLSSDTPDIGDQLDMDVYTAISQLKEKYKEVNIYH